MNLSKTMDSDAFRLRGLWDMRLIFQPDLTERVFCYDVYIVQANNQGCCYCFGKKSGLDKSLIGVDTRTFTSTSLSLDIAILDAAYSSLQHAPVRNHVLMGTACQKAAQRAELIVREVEHYIRKERRTQRRVAVVGAIGNVILSLMKRGFDVKATDLDRQLIKKQINGVTIEDGVIDTLKFVQQSDVAVITGMTLATDTLADIMQAAKKSDTRLILVAETGAWFAQEYCYTFGIDSVFAEPFPFYIFSGTNKIHLYRKGA